MESGLFCFSPLSQKNFLLRISRRKQTCGGLSPFCSKTRLIRPWDFVSKLVSCLGIRFLWWPAKEFLGGGFVFFEWFLVIGFFSTPGCLIVSLRCFPGEWSLNNFEEGCGRESSLLESYIYLPFGGRTSP